LVIRETYPVATSERGQKVLNMVTPTIAAEMPKRVFLSGDGAVVHAVSEWLMGAGLRGEDVCIECFFNNPQRKSAA
jgi:hypothetical protein